MSFSEYLIIVILDLFTTNFVLNGGGIVIVLYNSMLLLLNHFTIQWYSPNCNYSNNNIALLASYFVQNATCYHANTTVYSII